MKWIASSTTLPIPRLFYYSVDEQYPYMITEKCDGHILADKFGLFPFEAKVRLFGVLNHSVIIFVIGSKC